MSAPVAAGMSHGGEDDVALVMRTLAGDRAAFGTLVQRYEEPVRRVARERKVSGGGKVTEDYLRSQDGKQLYVIVKFEGGRGRSLEFRRVYDGVAGKRVAGTWAGAAASPIPGSSPPPTAPCPPPPP